MESRLIVAVALTAVVTGAAGAGAGMMTVGSSAGSALPAASSASSSSSGSAGRAGVVGRVTEKSGDSFTLRTADGSTRVVYVSGSTAFSKTSSATAGDVSVETTIMARGTAKGSNGVSAENVSIGQAGAMGASPAGPAGQ